MYITYKKLNRSKNKSRRGYILLESMGILMLIFTIGMYINKYISNNFIKSDLFYTEENRNLNEANEILLYNAKKDIEGNKEMFDKVKNGIKFDININTVTNINTNGVSEGAYLYEYPRSGSSKVIIKENTAYIVNEKSNSKSYKYLEVDIYISDAGEKIILKPTVYKTDYIIN